MSYNIREMARSRSSVDEATMRAYFESHGIIIPNAPIARANLYKFLKFGNGALRGGNEKGRITHTKKMQSRWVGKRVQETFGYGTRGGELKHLIARKPITVAYVNEGLAEDGITDSHGASAFDAFVKWDEGKPSVVTLRYLELVESSRTVG